MEKMDEYITLLFEDCVIEDEKLYFVSKNFNGLFCMNFRLGKVQFLDKIPLYEFRSERLVSKIIKYKESLYLIPMNAEELWIFNLENFLWHKIHIKRIGNRRIYGKFFQAFFYEKTLFLFGSGYPAIVCVDVETESVSYIEKVYSNLKEKQEQLKDCYVRTDYAQKGSLIYMSSCVANKVLIFDLKTRDYQWKDIGPEGNRYAGITNDRNCFWLAPRCSTSIVKWDGDSKYCEYKLPGSLKQGEYNFLGIIYDGEKICLPGMNNETTLLFSSNDLINIKIVKQKYLAYKRLINNYIVTLNTEGYLTVSLYNQVIWSDFCIIKKEELFKKYKIGSELTYETDILNQQIYIDYMVEKLNEMDNSKTDMGMGIYRVLVGV